MCRTAATVTPLHTLARLCECKRIASYRVTVTQLSAEDNVHAANLYLCGMCYRDWLAVEGSAFAAAGRLDTRSIDGQHPTCYGNGMNGDYPGDTVKSIDMRPLPKRIDDMLAELRAYLLANKFDFPGKVQIHISEKRGVFKLELPPEVKRY